MSTVKEKPSRWLTAALVGSAGLCIGIWACRVVQPDILAAVIIVPAWCWLLPGMVLWLMGCRRRNRLSALVVLAVWVAFTATQVEESRSLLRMGNWPTDQWKTAREQGRGLRVVSLNCYIGRADSVREVAVWEPDVVLLQESPSREKLGELTHELFGETGAFVHGGDTSILADGQLHSGTRDGAPHFVHATVQLPSGLEADAISLHLAPPVFRLDFWTPGFWIDHRNKRMMHREQIAAVVEHFQAIPASRNLIVGGDFNSPPNEAALALLKGRLVDAFRQAGRGWGATGTSNLPLFRVDQIWISDSLRAGSVTAHRTVHSDHRMVVCDLMLSD